MNNLYNLESCSTALGTTWPTRAGAQSFGLELTIGQCLTHPEPKNSKENPGVSEQFLPSIGVFGDFWWLAWAMLVFLMTYSGIDYQCLESSTEVSTYSSSVFAVIAALADTRSTQPPAHHDPGLHVALKVRHVISQLDWWLRHCQALLHVSFHAADFHRPLHGYRRMHSSINRSLTRVEPMLLRQYGHCCI